MHKSTFQCCSGQEQITHVSETAAKPSAENNENNASGTIAEPPAGANGDSASETSAESLVENNENNASETVKAGNGDIESVVEPPDETNENNASKTVEASSAGVECVVELLSRPT